MKNLLYSFFLVCIVACNNSGKKPSTTMERSNYEKACIERVLALDDSLGTVRNEAPKEISISESIKQYTAALKGLNFEGCPPKFANAFKDHRQAWEEILIVTDKYPKMRGELHEVFDSISVSKDSVEFKTRLDKIWATWEMVDDQSKP